MTDLVQQEPYLVARVVRHDDPVDSTAEAEAAMTAVMEQVENYISMLPNVPEEVLTMVRGVEEPGWLADLIAFSPEFTSDQRQELLEILDPIERLRRLSVLIQKRLDVLNLRQQIQTEAQAGMDKQQREYYLREQLRAIQKELGESGTEAAVAGELREKIDAAGMPEEVKAKALIQVERLEQQHPFSPEIGVIRGYLDWLIELPWAVETEDRLDLAEAARVLERGPLRPGEGQGAHPRVHRRAQAGGGPPARARSSASSARRASARPVSAARSRAPSAATTSACRWAACATRRRSAVTGAPTSAPCRAG